MLSTCKVEYGSKLIKEIIISAQLLHEPEGACHIYYANSRCVCIQNHTTKAFYQLHAAHVTNICTCVGLICVYIKPTTFLVMSFSSLWIKGLSSRSVLSTDEYTGTLKRMYSGFADLSTLFIMVITKKMETYFTFFK